jgi:hypothetical protein
MSEAEARIKNFTEAMASPGVSAALVAQLKEEEAPQDALRAEREGFAKDRQPNVGIRG